MAKAIKDNDVGKALTDIRLVDEEHAATQTTIAAADTLGSTRIEHIPGLALKDCGLPPCSSGIATGTSTRGSDKRRCHYHRRPPLPDHSGSQTITSTTRPHHSLREETRTTPRKPLCSLRLRRTRTRETSRSATNQPPRWICLRNCC